MCLFRTNPNQCSSGARLADLTLLEDTEAHSADVGSCGRTGGMQGLGALPNLSSEPSSQAKHGDKCSRPSVGQRKMWAMLSDTRWCFLCPSLVLNSGSRTLRHVWEPNTEGTLGRLLPTRPQDPSALLTARGTCHLHIAVTPSL